MGESGTGTARFNYLYQLCHPPRTDARRWKGLAWQQKRVRSHQPLQQEEGVGCEPKHEQGEGIKPPIEAIKSLKKVTVWPFTTVKGHGVEGGTGRVPEAAEAKNNSCESETATMFFGCKKH